MQIIRMDCHWSSRQMWLRRWDSQEPDCLVLSKHNLVLFWMWLCTSRWSGHFQPHFGSFHRWTLAQMQSYGLPLVFGPNVIQKLRDWDSEKAPYDLVLSKHNLVLFWMWLRMQNGAIISSCWVSLEPQWEGGQDWFLLRTSIIVWSLILWLCRNSVQLIRVFWIRSKVSFEV